MSSPPPESVFCVGWTAEVRKFHGSTTEGGAFAYRNARFRFQFLVHDEYYVLRLTLVEGHPAGPFVVTVLVEKGCEPGCQTLARKRVSELPWSCTIAEHSLCKYSSVYNIYSSPWIRVRFVVIFEDDTDNIERPIQTECSSAVWDFPSNLDSLSLDFANLLKNETLPDVSLKCGGRDRAIPVHRAVLAARSEVFAAMFRNEMAESRSGELDVRDVDDDVIDPFLQYVYSGRIPSSVSDGVVPGLYAAADKYAVHALREACRDRMVDLLTEENCVHFLTVADAHGDADFKKSVMEFICSHKAVFKGEAWRDFTQKPSLLAMEVYQSKIENET